MKKERWDFAESSLAIRDYMPPHLHMLSETPGAHYSTVYTLLLALSIVLGCQSHVPSRTRTNYRVDSLDAECELHSVALSGDLVVGGPAYDGKLRVWSLAQRG